MQNTDTMNSLQKKIRNTTLFSAEEKVDLLIGLDHMTNDQKNQLEISIDEYQTKHLALTQQFKNDTQQHLNTLVTQTNTDDEEILKAAKLMKDGLNDMI